MFLRKRGAFFKEVEGGDGTPCSHGDCDDSSIAKETVQL